MSERGFQVDREGPVGVIRLDRPPVNAITFELIEQLAGVISHPEEWFPEAECLVMVAKGPHFSAGMDRTELTAVNRDRLTGAAAALEALLKRHLPLVTGVQGTAAGTGFILAACADVLVVADGAEVWLPETELGMLGGAGHARRWLPMPLVRRMVLVGEKVAGTVLHRYGALRPTGGLSVEETAMETARRLVARDPSVLALARDVLADLDTDAAAVHDKEMRITPIPTIRKGQE